MNKNSNISIQVKKLPDTPSPINTLVDQKQKECPHGYFFYENSIYSLCYPQILVPEIDNAVVDQSNGTYPEKNVIIFHDKQYLADISIIPSFKAEGGGSCVSKQTIVVSGQSALKEIHRTSLNNQCGDITEIATIVQTNHVLPLWILYEEFQGGKIRLLNEYQTMVNTLKIKINYLQNK